MRWGTLSLVALLGSVNAGCVNFHPGPLAIAGDSAGAAPRLLWSLHAGRAIGEPLAADAGTLYAAGVDRVVRAISLDSGRVRWGFRLTGIVLGGVIRADSSVYVASVRPVGNVLALSAASGRKLWSRNVGEVAASVSLVNGLLLVPTRKGDLLGLTTRDGVIQWRRRVGYVRSGAVSAAGAAVISSLDSMFRISTANGNVLQRRTVPGAMLAEWRQAGALLIGATTDSLLIAVRAADLTTVWQARLDAPVFSTPAVAGDTVYVATRIGSVYRVLLPGGGTTRIAHLNWALTSGPVLADGLLLVGGADGTLRGLDHSGAERWRVAAWRPIDVPPIALTAGFIVVGGNGDFHRYAP